VLNADGGTDATFPAGNHPHAVAFDGTDIWVTNESSAAVTRFRVP